MSILRAKKNSPLTVNKCQTNSSDFFNFFFHFAIIVDFFFFAYDWVQKGLNSFSHAYTHTLTKKKKNTGENTCSVIKWKTTLTIKWQHAPKYPLSLTHQMRKRKNDCECERERDVNESDHNQSNWPFDFDLKQHLQNVLSTVHEKKKNRGNTKKSEKKVVFKIGYSQGLIVFCNQRIFIDDILDFQPQALVHGAFNCILAVFCCM